MIVTGKLGYHKFCVRWVSKMLTDQHKEQIMCRGQATYERRYVDKCKRNDVHSSSPKVEVYSVLESKNDTTVFQGEKLLILVDIMQGLSTIAAIVCYETVTKLRRAIQTRRRGK